VRTLIPSKVARELASTLDDQVVFSDRIVVDQPGSPDRRFRDGRRRSYSSR
jgi:hypothetical protein